LILPPLLSVISSVTPMVTSIRVFIIDICFELLASNLYYMCTVHCYYGVHPFILLYLHLNFSCSQLSISKYFIDSLV